MSEYKCIRCGSMFKQKNDIRRHINRKILCNSSLSNFIPKEHENEILNKTIVYVEWKCICNVILSSKQDFDEHQENCDKYTIEKLKKRLEESNISRTNTETIQVATVVADEFIEQTSLDFDTKLSNKLRTVFNDDEQSMFRASFEGYLNYRDTEFVVDFDLVRKWVGYSKKYHAKRALVDNFTENVDYKIQNSLLRSQERVCETDYPNSHDNRSGNNENSLRRPQQRVCETDYPNSHDDYSGSNENFAPTIGGAKKNENSLPRSGERVCETDYQNFSAETSAKKTENVDYKIEKPLPRSGERFCETDYPNYHKNHGGQNKETIMLTVVAFKKFCMKAGTVRADKIHDYYIKLERCLHDMLRSEINEKDEQLVLKDEQLVLKDEQKELNLLQNFDNKPVVYLIIVEKNVVEFGYSNNIKRRLGEHKRAISKNISLEYCVDSIYNREIEIDIKKSTDLLSLVKDRVEPRIFSKEYNGKNHTELIRLDSEFTIDVLYQLVIDIRQSINSVEIINKLNTSNIQLANIIYNISQTVI
jgi:hypothetical protein